MEDDHLLEELDGLSQDARKLTADALKIDPSEVYRLDAELRRLANWSHLVLGFAAGSIFWAIFAAALCLR